MAVETDVGSLAAQAEALRALHYAPALLVLPNVWDVASARQVERAGFPAVATSSYGVARSLGYGDADSMPPDEAFAVVRRIADRVQVPVTADLEGGYGLEPRVFVERLLGAGAVGCNLEDSDHHGHGTLVPPDAHAARLQAVKAAARAAGVDIVVNARTDGFLRGELTPAVFDDALARARVYAEAGADCVYPIGLVDEERIAEFVAGAGVPVNVMAAGAPPLPRLHELGVARVSFAGETYRVAYGALRERLEGIERPGS